MAAVRCEVQVIDEEENIKRKWEADVHGDSNLFIYPSLNVGSMKVPIATWKLTEAPAKTSEELARNDPDDNKKELDRKLVAHMKAGEDYLRQKMMSTMREREKEKAAEARNKNKSNQRAMLAAAMKGTKDEDHDYSQHPHDQLDSLEHVEAEKKEEEKMMENLMRDKYSPKKFRQSVMRRASAVPTSVSKISGVSGKASNLAQSQSVDAYTTIMKRGGKFRRAIRR